MIPYINISRKYKHTKKEFKPFKQSHIYHIYTKNKAKKPTNSLQKTIKYCEKNY